MADGAEDVTARIVPRRDAAASVLNAPRAGSGPGEDAPRRAADRAADSDAAAAAGGDGAEDESDDEGGAKTYRVVAGSRYRSSEEKLFIARFPPTLNEAAGMTKEEGNLGLGKWKIAAGLENQSIEGATQTAEAKAGGDSAPAPTRRSYFDDSPADACPGWASGTSFTLQEVTSEILGAGATVAAQKEKQVFAGGARYVMLYVEEGAEPDTFYAVPATDMWRCNLMPRTAAAGAAADGPGPSARRRPADAGADAGAGAGAAGSLKTLFDSRRAHGSGKAVADMEESMMASKARLARRAGGARAEAGGDNDWEHEHGVASDDDEEIGYGGEALDMPDENVTFGWSDMLRKERDEDEDELLGMIQKVLDSADADEGAGAAADGDGAGTDGDPPRDEVMEDADEDAAPKAQEVHIVRTAGAKREREEDDADGPGRKEPRTEEAPGAVDGGEPAAAVTKVTKEEVRALLRSRGGLMRSRDLTGAFKGRLATKADKKLFAEIVKSIAKKATEKDQKGMIILK